MNAKKVLWPVYGARRCCQEWDCWIVKKNPKGRFIQPNEHHGEDELFATEGVWALTGDEDAILVCAVGLFDDGELKVKAAMMQGDYNDYEWFTFDEFTHCYCELFEFVVDNLDNADQEPIDWPI